MKRLIFSILCFVTLSTYADWQTHFSYTNVSQIAMSKDRVFGLSDGLLFSVDKQTEKMVEWTKQRGMHGAGIWQIGYDDVSDMLLAVYGTGQIDLIKGDKVTYLSDFYNKDMTASKRANNISFHKGRAYLSMEFGIISFDMRKHEFVDTYYIGPEASEVIVQDIVFKEDSIFAFTDKLIYRASLKDKVVDYRFWKSEPLSNRIQRDPDKGKKYTDAKNNVWSAGGGEGIVLDTYANEHFSYKPNGPMTNIPYRLHCDGDKLYMFSGGRWTAQYFRAGDVMMYQNNRWTAISQGEITSKTNKPAYDFMNIAVDPKDHSHFFVTSYGTGVYEFHNNELKNHFLPENSTLSSILPDQPDLYTRTDGAVFDENGNLLIVDAGGDGSAIVVLTKDGKWEGVNLLIDGKPAIIYTPGEMLIDATNSHYKWIPYVRSEPGLILWDDNGTLTNSSDDRGIKRHEWIDQDGNTVTVGKCYAVHQDFSGNIWVGTDKGVVIIESDVDYFQSNKCRRLRIKMPDDTYLMEADAVVAFCMDNNHNMWVGTEGQGVYVLSPDGSELIAHYTTDNSIMPANGILDLAYDQVHSRMYIGTGQGLVSYSEIDTAIKEPLADDEDVDYGSMLNWTLHPAYANINAITASNTDIYALSDGALFSVNRMDETMTYYNKVTGLSSSNIHLIAYNKTVNKLLIIYQNGMIDFLSDKGITAQTDLFIKGESKEMLFNSVLLHKQFAYFAMSFGIVIMDMQKCEIADTYYIGENAADENVISLAISNDTLYAVTDKKLYAGFLKDNLIDYAYWHSSDLPTDTLTSSIATANGDLYLLQDSTLYRRENGVWKPITDERLLWIRSQATHLLASTPQTLIEIAADGTIIPLTNEYNVQDALLDNGEYWLAAGAQGLLRYKNKSYQAFLPNSPYSNYSYRLKFDGDRLMVAQGARWTAGFGRSADFFFYDYTAKHWTTYLADQIMWELQQGFYDIMNFAVDPSTPKHFFATSYGTGVAEFLDGHAIKVYNELNSSLKSVTDNDKWQANIRTDGALYDKHGNLWVLNTGDRGTAISIRSPQGLWYPLNVRSNGQKVTLTTPGEMIADVKFPNSKWFVDVRSSAGLILHDDGGTPFDQTDDQAVKRSEFTDQLGNIVTPNYFYCAAQDHDGYIWVGTEGGPFYVETAEKFLQSNACNRPIIYRNDGTNLVDYLLHGEEINAICVDGGNRKWFGTSSSGAFLMSADGTETIYHFTTKNSPLPSDNILSIAIHPTSGEVFFGTSAGLASYRSDASEPTEDYDNVYAFPNPVHPNFEGVITISGLMENSIVNIIDGGGNLVCKTRSNGGIAIWDGRNLRGERVSTGIYTVLCNTADGENHAVTKILVTH